MTVDINGFNERLLRLTGSKSTVKSYATAIRKFEEFSKQVLGLSLELVMDQLKSGELDVYRTLDKFLGWLSTAAVFPKPFMASATNVSPDREAS